MDTNKKIARIVGVLFIITTGAAIISGSVLLPIIDSPDVLTLVSENKNQVMLGALFYFVMAAGGASITLPMYQILRKQNEGLALGAVGFRFIEGAIFMVGVICVLSLVPVSQAFMQEGALDTSHFQLISKILISGYTISHAVVPGVFAFSIGALMYYYIFFRSKLIPRWLSVWGLIGIILGIINGLLDMFGGIPNETFSLMLDLPIFAQEMVLAVWLIVKGFNYSSLASETASQ